VQRKITLHILLMSLVINGLTACTQSVSEHRPPTIDTPAQFSGYARWQMVSEPMATTQTWWQTFNDNTLNQLVEALTINNATLQASEAQYRAAVAALMSSQASQMPILSSTASANNGTVATSNSFSSSSLPTNSNYTFNASVAWELDLWGRIRQTVQSNESKAQASLADLYAARLSSQALLVQNYFQLRNTDVQIDILNASINAYQRFVRLTQARQQAGVISSLDVAQARTQLHTAQTQLLDLQEQRARYQHAIASLLGQTATGFTLAKQTNKQTELPALPTLIPSTLLLNRPDIIASERRVAAANAQIGVTQSAFFPTINLVGSTGYRNTELGSLINVPNTIWSLGPSMAFTLFDGGLREANVKIAEAGLDQATANYKQIVLSAFQEVEDNLTSLSILSEELVIQQQALDAATQAHRIAQSQYRAGINSALNVITAQTAELTAKRALTNVKLRQQLASLVLLKNSGGYLPIP
jgi:NodT family efflux transporter outer membrane factor (OMF) lipoprotein